MSETLTGRVQRVVYAKDNYYILNMDVVDSSVTCKKMEAARGNIHGLSQIKQGVSIRFVGSWKTHPKYGRQFSIQSWEPWGANNADKVTFLNTCVPGFLDTKFTTALVQACKDETFSLLTEGGSLQDNPPPDLDVVKLSDAILGWQSSLATRDLSEVLSAGGISASDIRSAIIRFGTDAASVIRANPFRLMEVPGLSFARVDRLAVSQGVAPNDPRRLEGAILWALQDAALQGHLYLQRGELSGRISDLFRQHDLLGVHGSSDLNSNLEAATKALVDRKALILSEGRGVYLPEFHHFELESARLLAAKLVPSPISVDLQAFLEDYERRNKITLSEAQRCAVQKLSESRVLVLTGLPGTGKTTAVRALVRLFEDAKLSFTLMAPTGIAAKRLSSLTGHPASTVHRALKYDGTSWGHGEHNRYIVDGVIVDEMSMVDMELFFRLLSSLQPETMVVLVGDDAQLPSVGPGNVLRELVECSAVPSVRLTQIFRQSAKGAIVSNSHKINGGSMPQFGDPKDDSEFKFVRSSDEERIADFVVEMASKLKSRNENFQVLAPKYDGLVGVNNLNLRLRDRLNPEGPKEWKSGDLHFRLGDRLMVIRNDYKLGVYNGDVGKLMAIYDDSLVVKIHGAGEGGVDLSVKFSTDAAEEKLRLAYAITVHKSQGSEFDTVILPIVRSQGRMLQRNLLYTAITRARKRVWLLGEESAIQQAVLNNKVVQRNTALGPTVLSFYKS